MSQADSCDVVPADHDTIVAPGTARGNGAIAIIRITGPEARRTLQRLFRPLGSHLPWDVPRQLVLGDVIDSEGVGVDRGLGVWMPRSASPTGQDYVELHVHGGLGLVNLVVQAAVAAGARPALPGEFLKRGFLQGRIDLTEAEAVATILSARTSAAARAAARNLAGHLGQAATQIRNDLLTAHAIIEAATDFPDEDLPAVDEVAIRQALQSAKIRLEELLRGSRRSLRVQTGARVVLLGKPNVGKSSLFNWLVGHERAIVSPEPGTTRDTIEAILDLEGMPVTLIDTAGLRDEAGHTEQAGMARTRQEAAAADLVLELRDDPRSASDWTGEGPREGGSRLLVRTKADQIFPEARTPEPGEIWVSSHSGEGMERLLETMLRLLGGHQLSGAGEESLLTTERQIKTVKLCSERLASVQSALDHHLGYELVVVHLREALEPLDALLGRQASEDVLSVLFSRFCIGK